MTGYHHWFFLSALADALNLEFRAFTVAADGVRLGAVPMLFRRSGPVSKVNFLPVGCIGPVIRGGALRAGRMGELLLGVEPVLLRHRAVAARWAFSPGLRTNPEELAIPKFEASEWENFVISATKSVDDVWKSMSTGRRQSVQQTEKRGVVVTDSLAEEITGWFPGQIVGPSVRSMSPHTLLHWDSIKWSRERDRAYDMGGVPSDGVRAIKHSLAGETETAVGLFRFRPSAAYRAATALRNWGPVRDNWVRMRRIIGD